MARTALGLTLLIYLILSGFYSTATPTQEFVLPDSVPLALRETPLRAGQGPDEKEYLLYVRSLAETGKPPRPTPAQRTSPRDYVCYQAQHPPLFFALSVPLWKLFGGLGEGFWFLWRGLCALLGAGVIVFGARAAQRAFPESRLVAVAAAPAIAFVPMLGHLMGNVSNEPLAMLLGAWVWWRAVEHARAEVPTVRQAAVLGLVLGLALLTRLTAVLWVFAAGVTLLSVHRQRALKPVLVLVGVAVLVLVPWLGFNLAQYGKPLLRTFNNPLLAHGATLSDFLGSGIRPEGSPTVFSPIIVVLFWSATGWTPFWIIGRYLEGGMPGMAQNAAYIVLVDMAILLGLFWSASQARQGKAPRDGGLRTLLWVAGGNLLILLAILLQQMFWVDWNVLQSAGRYLTAVAPTNALLLLGAVVGVTRKLPERAHAVVGGLLALVLLAADLHSLSLVRKFYADNPYQQKYQKIAPEDSGRAYDLSDTP